MTDKERSPDGQPESEARIDGAAGADAGAKDSVPEDDDYTLTADDDEAVADEFEEWDLPLRHHPEARRSFRRIPRRWDRDER